jgi:hypothetical protein
VHHQRDASRWRRPPLPPLAWPHSFVLTAADGGTRLVQSETFRGLLVPLSGKLLGGLEADYAALNRALKQRVERQQS